MVQKVRFRAFFFKKKFVIKTMLVKGGSLTISSQKKFADELVRKYQVISEQNVPLRVGVRL